MGNLNGYRGSPCHGTTSEFLQHQLTLQKQIVARQVQLGINPVLTGFAGHVPASLVTKYPGAVVTHLDAWHGHMLNGTYALDPNDPLFSKIGVAYIKRQLEAMSGTGYDGGEISSAYITATLPLPTPPALVRAHTGRTQAEVVLTPSPLPPPRAQPTPTVKPPQHYYLADPYNEMLHGSSLFC
jgi:hypothetical protein